MVKGSLVFNNKIYLKKYNRKVLLFIGSYSSPRLLVSNWSTSEKTTAITILTFPFSPREESPSPSTKGRIQSSPPFPARLRLFVSFLCILQPASLSLLVLALLLLAALTPPAPWSPPPWLKIIIGALESGTQTLEKNN